MINPNLTQKPIRIQKYLPHNFLAEKMVLSCLLINPEAIEFTFKKISIEMFYFKNHQELYKSILLLHTCLLYTSPSPRDQRGSRMPSSA